MDAIFDIIARRPTPLPAMYVLATLGRTLGPRQTIGGYVGGYGRVPMTNG